jgi:nifR3 family TIM-barrel protein
MSINGFWDKLPKPFFVQAPMADVTDAAFRRLIAKYGQPDVMWTEFVSADGLSSPGRDALLKDFIYTDAERPIVAQIFGSKPENIERASALARELGFDGVDINMGCPDRTIEKQCAGAAMMKNYPLAVEVINAAKRGAKTGEEGGIPVSIKTRVGYNKVELEPWLPVILDAGVSAVTIHARTRKEMSDVPARWEHVRESVVIRNRMGVDTLILGNGDVRDLNDARQKVAETGCDGVMLGRAIFGNPWLYAALRGRASGVERDLPPGPASLHERFSVMVEHTQMFEQLLGDAKSFAVMKKHYKAYVNGFDGAKEFRMRLMEAEDASEVARMVKEWEESNTDVAGKNGPGV